MWLHPGLLQSMVEKYTACSLIKEILIINNDETRRIDLKSQKVRLIGSGENIFVNPAWNLGVKEAKTECVIIANDDIIIPELENAVQTIDSALKPGMVIFPHKSCYPQKGKLTGLPRIEQGDSPDYGFGVFMSMYKSTYHIIPDELRIWWGDHLQWDYSEKQMHLKGIEIQTDMRGTTRTMNLKGESHKEKMFYQEWIKDNTPLTHTGTIILVLKTGGDFTYSDVSLLARKVKGSQVKCLMEVDEVYDLKHNLQLLPFHGTWKGWWSKMNLFAPELEQYRPYLYLDLDTAVVGNLHGILPPAGYEDKFITLEDFYQKERLASGMMWIPKGSRKIGEIWNQWIKSPESHMNRYRGDQDFLRAVTQADEFWQNITNKITTFKPRKQGWLQELPDEKSVICFHGKPRIPKAADSIEWVNNYIAS